MRRRYIAVRVDSFQVPDRRNLQDAVWTSILKLFGEYGASQTELTLVQYDPQEKVAILRCSHKALDMVKASIAAVREVNREEAALHILFVSGTLRSLRKKIQNVMKQETVPQP